MRTVHLIGDSISRGYALGSFSDSILPTHPLYAFRSIWATANALMEENGIALRFAYGSPGMGDSTAPDRTAARVASGMIGANDIVIIEDAGDTSMNPDQYQAELETLIAAAAPAEVYVMTMFDYPPAVLSCQFDTEFTGEPSGCSRTINDAIRAAALSQGATVIDMNVAMDNFRAYMAGQVANNDFDDLGIHPFVFSQSLMVGEIFRGMGITPFIRSILSLTTPARANYLSLQYGARYWGDSWPGVFLSKAIFG